MAKKIPIWMTAMALRARKRRIRERSRLKKFSIAHPNSRNGLPWCLRTTLSYWDSSGSAGSALSTVSREAEEKFLL